MRGGGEMSSTRWGAGSPLRRGQAAHLREPWVAQWPSEMGAANAPLARVSFDVMSCNQPLAPNARAPHPLPQM
jgi:hypothetical protein